MTVRVSTAALGGEPSRGDSPGGDVQQPLQAFALLVGQRAGEDALALLISALAGCTDEPPEGAPPGPQNAVVHQNLAGAGEQRGAAHCGVSGLGGKLNIDLLRSQNNVTKLRDNFAECCDAIRAAVDFVQNECRCQSSRLLGSSTMLVPIVHYMFGLPRHEVPNDQTDRLRTAVYLFGLAQPFSRYGVSRVGNFIRTELDVRDAGDHAFPLEGAIEKVRGWEGIRTIEDLAEWNHDLTLHLIQGLSGAKVQYARNAPEVDHIFPRSELRKQGKAEDDINDLANFWILAQGKNRNKSNRRPKDYFADVSDRQLKKALIDPSMLDYRRFKKFSQQRRAALLEQLSKTLLLTDVELQRK